MDEKLTAESETLLQQSSKVMFEDMLLLPVLLQLVNV